uniref:Uncharacterized protein n=1 Tax=Lepeophtheirus salmonis TaxID=72036 RepID=A0A0K2SVQ6_LEPSM
MNECGPSGDDSSLIEDWPCSSNYESHWQRQQKSVRDRSEKCFERGEMSDIGILSVDENWWFGATVKDFYGHKFLLGSASPVLHHILYEMEFCESNKDIILNLNSKLNVTLTRTKTYDSERLELNGIPPIATEALLEYIYKDKFCKSDFENGYSRNLLWRLWHASVALEMDHLAQITSDIHFNERFDIMPLFRTLTFLMYYCQLLMINSLNSNLNGPTYGVNELIGKLLNISQ